MNISTKTLTKALAAAVILVVSIAVCAPTPDASNAHFVVVNNNDYQMPNLGTVLKLDGPKTNPSLNVVASLATGQPADGQYNSPTVAVMRAGPDICVFLAETSNTGANAISSFLYPSGNKVGDFVNNQVSTSKYGMTIVPSGSNLLASYGGVAIATWQLQAGCQLNMLQNYSFEGIGPVDNMGVTPDGKTLIADDDGYDAVISFSLGPTGIQGTHGPYFYTVNTWGLDVTADSKYAMFAVVNPLCSACVEVMALPINGDGSLGNPIGFGGDGSLGKSGMTYVRLSPDERFLFGSGSGGLTMPSLLTLRFTENPLSVTYGCARDVRLPSGATGDVLYGMATAATTGAGTGLYVFEDGFTDQTHIPAVGTMKIDPSSGCLRETPQSPALINDPVAQPVSLVAWPPRPF